MRLLHTFAHFTRTGAVRLKERMTPMNEEPEYPMALAVAEGAGEVLLGFIEDKQDKIEEGLEKILAAPPCRGMVSAMALWVHGARQAYKEGGVDPSGLPPLFRVLAEDGHFKNTLTDLEAKAERFMNLMSGAQEQQSESDVDELLNDMHDFWHDAADEQTGEVFSCVLASTAFVMHQGLAKMGLTHEH